MQMRECEGPEAGQGELTLSRKEGWSPDPRSGCVKWSLDFCLGANRRP